MVLQIIQHLGWPGVVTPSSTAPSEGESIARVEKACDLNIDITINSGTWCADRFDDSRGDGDVEGVTAVADGMDIMENR